MGRCKHKWVSMEDGSLDKFCVRCSLKAKQMVMIKPTINLTIEHNVESSVDEITKKISRELMKVNGHY